VSIHRELKAIRTIRWSGISAVLEKHGKRSKFRTRKWGKDMPSKSNRLSQNKTRFENTRGGVEVPKTRKRSRKNAVKFWTIDSPAVRVQETKQSEGTNSIQSKKKKRPPDQVVRIKRGGKENKSSRRNRVPQILRAGARGRKIKTSGVI